MPKYGEHKESVELFLRILKPNEGMRLQLKTSTKDLRKSIQPSNILVDMKAARV